MSEFEFEETDLTSSQFTGFVRPNHGSREEDLPELWGKSRCPHCAKGGLRGDKDGYHPAFS